MIQQGPFNIVKLLIIEILQLRRNPSPPPNEIGSIHSAPCAPETQHTFKGHVRPQRGTQRSSGDLVESPLRFDLNVLLQLETTK